MHRIELFYSIAAASQSLDNCQMVCMDTGNECYAGLCQQKTAAQTEGTT